MSTAARVKYKVVKCSSEDPDFPVSELLAHSSQTRGWQTARFCEFPQEIGLEFESPVHLRQVQFLSHQSKIATKIELFTAMPADGCRYEAATFKRLGYLSLDSNERSQFQARELKSVYVDVSAQYLRVVLHKCHVNRYNIVNQVGLIALHCSGEVLQPDLTLGPPASPSLALPDDTPAPRNSQLENAQASALRSSRPDNAPAAAATQRPKASPDNASRAAAQLLQRRQKEAEEAAARLAEEEEAAARLAEDKAREAALALDAALAREAAIAREAASAREVEAARREADAAREAEAAARRQRLAPKPERKDRQERQQPRVDPPRVEQPSSEQAADGDEACYDPRTLEKIRSLTVAKEKAVAAEDYGEAKRCKEMLARLRETGQLLRDLEERKRAAVQNEDFDSATALKAEIDQLRSTVEHPQGSPSHARAPSGEHGFPSGDGGKTPNSPPPAQTAPRGGHQPVMAQASGYDNASGAAGGQRPGSQGRLQALAPEQSPHRGSAPTLTSYNDEPSHGSGPSMTFDMGAGAGGGSRLVSSPQAGGRSSPLAGGGTQGRGGYGVEEVAGGGMGSNADNGYEQEQHGSSEVAHHLQGVPGVEDILASPELLSATLEKEKECIQLVQLFGDCITRCIYSKTWSLRDAALQKLALDLREGARAGDDPNFLLQGYAAVLKRTVADKNVQVSLSSGGLLQAVAQVLLESGRVRRNDAQPALEPIMLLLVERLGEANARVDKTARDALLDFARSQSVGATFTTQYLLRPPKKKTGAAVHARVYTSRLQVLTALATDFGVQPESRDGVPLESTVKLAMDWFNNKDGEVRESSVKLVAACYLHVGPRRIEGYLANLRPAQREIFDAEFERVSGGAPGDQGSTARAPPPSRGAVRVDDDYGDQYGSLPSPAQPPPRRNDGGAPSAGYQQVEALGDMDDEVEDFTCQFCSRKDPHFTPANLDVHYWRECPMLIQCQFCQQVIEVCNLRSHLLEECEIGFEAQSVGREMAPHQCPLCRANVGRCEMEDWREHLLSVGCPRNTRSAMQRGSASYDQR